MASARASGLRLRDLDGSSSRAVGTAGDASASSQNPKPKSSDTSTCGERSPAIYATTRKSASFTALVASLYLRPPHLCGCSCGSQLKKRSTEPSLACTPSSRATPLMRIALLLMCLHPAATRQTGKPRAVLFDFDGSLAQSEEAHRKRFVAATGVACDSARWDAECVGRNTEWIVCHLLGVDEPPAEVIEDLRQRVVSDAFLADVAPTKGGLELLKALREAAVPCAVVTSGLRAYVEACLERWGVAVDYIVAGDDEGVPHKPAPDPYLTACDHFDVAPADCVAVEDSPLACGAPSRRASRSSRSRTRRTRWPAVTRRGARRPGGSDGPGAVRHVSCARRHCRSDRCTKMGMGKGEGTESAAVPAELLCCPRRRRRASPVTTRHRTGMLSPPVRSSNSSPARGRADPSKQRESSSQPRALRRRRRRRPSSHFLIHFLSIQMMPNGFFVGRASASEVLLRLRRRRRRSCGSRRCLSSSSSPCNVDGRVVVDARYADLAFGRSPSRVTLARLACTAVGPA